ncbi:TetR/AcrR family transcriptional regulator [Lentilactobacillus hilgardii]|uniref:TetR/AcrR family transcriptional regulator n=1 Tax=Lentilactobacillus hilgardii TaxID=1588 RepID=UPI0021C4C036|nr:TetR/AcrR family transcriptional regulator [Lentilactobacillus hilgardii]MCP9332367.1 TetR/AcrR family transcriptional regulator [Lentilactobacillus hilgardii]MCP9348859.1 TetR/AcrR family transcriptional regulator [Lentilactobacillus hilgardii]MCP9351781.1 TetR/AcrR family transcriptional regulator [Lentilactobacillus hilgardii]
MGKRLPRDPQKEKAILAAAVKAFGTDSFRASTDKIAESAGVSKGSVFRYFDNKKRLYVAAVHQAMDTLISVVDFNVWTDSDDLVSMIIRATKYKTELSHRYPNEFALLTRVYAHDVNVPEKLRNEVFSTFNKWAEQTQNIIVDAIVDKLTLRPELDETTVKHYLSITIQEISKRIQDYFEKHPGLNRIEDMTEIIDEVKSYMDMVQYGIVKR